MALLDVYVQVYREIIMLQDYYRIFIGVIASKAKGFFISLFLH